MKVPIPSDWDGETYLCLQVEWPDSQEWVGLLNGLLTLLTRGRYWDERTGSVKGAQAIAREIFDRSYPYRSCDGGVIPPPEIVTICAGGGGDDEGSEDEMPAVTWLEVEDGVLYMYFGPCCKIAVGGEFTTIENPPPDGDGDDDPGDPLTWACNKSAGMALRFWAAADDAIVAIGAVQQSARPQVLIDTLPQFNISQRQAQIVAIAYAVDTDENFALSTDPDTEEKIKCAWAAVLEETNGLTSSEWATMQSVISSEFTAAQSAFLVTLMQAITATNFAWWAGAYAEVEADCECGGTGYSGVVTFDDDRNIILESQGAVLATAELQKPEKMWFVVQGAQNENFQEVHWDELLNATGTIQEIQIEFQLESSDVGDYYPAAGWDDADPTLIANYMTVQVAGAGAASNSRYPQPNKQVLIVTWDTPINLINSWVDFGMKLNPKDQDPNRQAYRFWAEITYAGERR